MVGRVPVPESGVWSIGEIPVEAGVTVGAVMGIGWWCAEKRLCVRG